MVHENIFDIVILIIYVPLLFQSIEIAHHDDSASSIAGSSATWTRGEMNWYYQMS